MHSPKIWIALTTILLLFFGAFAYANLSPLQQQNENWRDYNWQEKKNEDGIQVFTSDVSYSAYKAIYGKMRVNASIESLVALVKDTDACPQWADMCEESRVLESSSATEYYVYTYNDVPFPASDRDVVAKVTWQQTPQSRSVVMLTHPSPDKIPRTDAVRIEEADSRWYFTTQDDGSTLVETFAFINPNGPVPAWLTNLLIVESPYKTLRGMREIIASGTYDNASTIFASHP